MDVALGACDEHRFQRLLEPELVQAAVPEGTGEVIEYDLADGPLDRALVNGHAQLARARLECLAQIHGDRLYVELQRHGLESEKLVEPALIELAFGAGLPLVAANEPYFAARDDYEAHDALLCIADGAFVGQRGFGQFVERGTAGA